VEDVVAVAGRMREQVAERDRRLGIAQLRAPSASKPSRTCTSLTTGNTSPMGWSRPMRPRSTSCMAEAPVTALVIEAMRKTESTVIGSGLSIDRSPKAAL
jgi:hypothetical protein